MRSPVTRKFGLVDARMLGRSSIAEFSSRGMPPAIRVRANTPASQRGWSKPSSASFGVRRNGSEKPLRMLFSRLAGTGTSIVTISAWNPASMPRFTNLAARSRSAGMYTCSHLTLSQERATCSIGTVAMFESTYGTFMRAAARASAMSASKRAKPVIPIGATPKGLANRCPNRVTSCERCETSTRPRGKRRIRSSAARLFTSDMSSCTPPAMKPYTPAGRRLRARRSRSWMLSAFVWLMVFPGSRSRLVAPQCAQDAVRAEAVGETVRAEGAREVVRAEGAREVVRAKAPSGALRARSRGA